VSRHPAPSARRRTDAKLKGCRAVGIAGSKDKCEYVVNELGFMPA